MHCSQFQYVYIIFGSTQRLQMSASGIGDIQYRPFCEQRFAAVVQRGLAIQARWATAAFDNTLSTGVGVGIGRGIIQPPRFATVAAPAVAPAGSTAPQASATLATVASANSGWNRTASASAASAIAAPAIATAAENTLRSDSQSSDSPVVFVHRRSHKAASSHGVRRKRRGDRHGQQDTQQEETTVDSAAAAAATARPTVRDTGRTRQKRRRKCRW